MSSCQMFCFAYLFTWAKCTEQIFPAQQQNDLWPQVGQVTKRSNKIVTYIYLFDQVIQITGRMRVVEHYLVLDWKWPSIPFKSATCMNQLLSLKRHNLYVSRIKIQLTQCKPCKWNYINGSNQVTTKIKFVWWRHFPWWDLCNFQLYWWLHHFS